MPRKVVSACLVYLLDHGKVVSACLLYLLDWSNKFVLWRCLAAPKVLLIFSARIYRIASFRWTMIFYWLLPTTFFEFSLSKRVITWLITHTNSNILLFHDHLILSPDQHLGKPLKWPLSNEMFKKFQKFYQVLQWWFLYILV